jgi:hypothetical protein
MNWEMISAVGQMLGAVGVIISIIYLAAQIRNQNKESQRAAMNVLTTHWSDLNRSLVENPDLAALWLHALRSFDQLDGASKLRFGAHLGRFLRFADNLYLAVLDGTLDKRLWRGSSANTRRHRSVPRIPNVVGYTKTLAHRRILRAN